MSRRELSLRLALAVCVVALVALVTHRTPEVARAGNGDSNVPANAYDSGYAPDRGNFKAFRTSISAIDTPTTTIVLATPAFQVQGRTSFMLGTRFSASGATVTFRLAYVWRNPAAITDTSVTTRTFSWKTNTWAVPWTNQSWTVADNVIQKWGTPFTVTATAVQAEASYYPTTTGDLQMDTCRADTIRIVVVTAPSSGTAEFWCGS